MKIFLKNRIVMSEYIKYRDNYGKKMFVYLYVWKLIWVWDYNLYL